MRHAPDWRVAKRRANGESACAVADVPPILCQQLNMVPRWQTERAMLIAPFPLGHDAVVTDADEIAAIRIDPYSTLSSRKRCRH